MCTPVAICVFSTATAMLQDDYSPQGDNVTFAINSMEADIECVTVSIEDDDDVEETEIFTIRLVAGSYMEAEIEESLSYLVVTIFDDDGNTF